MQVAYTYSSFRIVKNWETIKKYTFFLEEIPKPESFKTDSCQLSWLFYCLWSQFSRSFFASLLLNEKEERPFKMERNKGLEMESRKDNRKHRS